MVRPSPELLVASTKAELPSVLCNWIALMASKAIDGERNKFTIALSGGSLPKFLSSLSDAFQKLNVDPKWDRWYVFLADERCVPIDDDDSNLKSIHDNFLNDAEVKIPQNQIYGINQELVGKLMKEEDDNGDSKTILDDIASHYEKKMKNVLDDDVLDLAVLGFGPDGHTCSLFPDHALLDDKSGRWVLSIADSPKPPPRRITLSLPFLNDLTRNVIVCGAGASKFPIIDAVFEKNFDYSKQETGFQSFHPKMVSPPPYPCSMVVPKDSLTWIVDSDAMVGEK